MVLPVTARDRHLTRTRASDNAVIFSRDQYGFTQARPIDRVLQYDSYVRDIQVLTDKNYLNVGDANSLTYPPDYLAYHNRGVNRSYEQLRGKVSNAQAGVNIVEYRQAQQMFSTRGKQVISLLLLLARGKFITAGRALGGVFLTDVKPKGATSGMRRQRYYDGERIRVHPGHGRTPKTMWVLPDMARKVNISASNLYLEWHFGVSPLISDIQASAQVLTNPIPSTRIFGSSQEYGKYKTHSEDSANPGTYTDEWWDTRFRYRQGADVAITNPNLALAGQLGLINPLSLAWEIVPFSFVADWFVNVGDWLQGFSDFAGMTLQYGYWSYHWWSWHHYHRVSKPLGGVEKIGDRHGKYLRSGRFAGITGGPSLTVRPLKLPSLTRAATTWSLISQIVQRR